MKRKTHTPDEKAKLVVEVLRGERTINEIAAEHGVHPSMLTRWKQEAVAGLPSVFENDAAKKRKEKKEHESEKEELYAQIGKLTTQVEWLKKIWPLSFRQRNDVQWSILARSVKFQSPYRPSCSRSIGAPCITAQLRATRDLSVKAHIDRIYTMHPEFGYRRIWAWLNRNDGICANPKTVLRHMREMGIHAIYPRHRTSEPNPSNPIYPYLLRGVKIVRPNHVWSIDITYIPVKTSWLYLTALIDWYSRYGISWEIDDTLEIGFVLTACERALRRAIPEIMSSDQGSHFTSPKHTKLFWDARSRISMDHRGRAYDNIFIERLWRSVKYENVYPMEYATPRDARVGISEYLRYYNEERPHQSLGYRTPKEVYLSKKQSPGEERMDK